MRRPSTRRCQPHDDVACTHATLPEGVVSVTSARTWRVRRSRRARSAAGLGWTVSLRVPAATALLPEAKRTIRPAQERACRGHLVVRVKVICHLTVPPGETPSESVIAPSRRETDGHPQVQRCGGGEGSRGFVQGQHFPGGGATSRDPARRRAGRRHRVGLGRRQGRFVFGVAALFGRNRAGTRRQRRRPVPLDRADRRGQRDELHRQPGAGRRRRLVGGSPFDGIGRRRWRRSRPAAACARP